MIMYNHIHICLVKDLAHVYFNANMFVCVTDYPITSSAAQSAHFTA